MYDALIFDCDGTLIDSMPAHFVAWRATLEPLGLDFPEARFYELAGTPSDRIIRMLAAERGMEVDPMAVARRKEASFLEILDLVPPIPSVIEIVREHQGRCKLAVGSGGYRRVIVSQLQRIGLADAFDAVVTAEDTERHKPEPDVFLEAAARLGVDPERCCVYEDADLGIEAARRAGMAWVDIRAFHQPCDWREIAAAAAARR